MKKLFLGALLLLLLSGCATKDTYLTVEPHAGSSGQALASNAVLAENYQELKKAILGFVERGQTEGAIHVANYNGSVEDDLTRATYEVMKQEPLGAYAVDYMSHDCTLIINYYEIRIDITFRRTLREIEAVEPIATQRQLTERLQEAAENYETSLALRIGGYRNQDVKAVIEDYCRENPQTIMETPQIEVSVYPDRGSVRIVELKLTYKHDREELENMEVAVLESVDAAAEYIRYRETDRDKAELLYTYLLERFSYIERESSTPVYDALCRGVADPAGLATAWQMICDQAGMECHTVQGLKDGVDYTWNILNVDGQYRHLDLGEDVLKHGPLTLRDDRQMHSYYWNQVQYPACEALTELPISAEPAPEPEEKTPAETEQPSAEEPQPPEEAAPEETT